VTIINKVKSRAFSVLIIVFIAIIGMGFYVVRYALFGAEWASAPFNTTVFRNATLAVGVVTDTNGVILADITDGRRTFAESAEVRRATLHAVGDKEGNIGTGALTVFAPELMGFNLITGSYSRSHSGRQIALTIDSRLNTAALKALDGRRGVVMVSNYETGEILCMVSSPTFDPGNPPESFDNSALEGVFVNRGIQSVYPPGSTYKLVTAAAAIEKIPRVFDRQFLCTGGVEIGSDTLTCPREHGEIDFIRGMQVSCNIVFGELAIDIGAAVLADYAAKLDLSERTTVSGITTAKGNFDRATSSINVAWSGIGQYTNTINPATMLRFVGAIANDGIAVNLNYLKKSGMSSVIPTSTERLLNRETAELLGEMMKIQSTDGFPGLEIHAKSGTAQVGGGNEPHAWYVGYITNANHPYAFVVIVENGGGGTAVAAPIANRVLQEAIR